MAVYLARTGVDPMLLSWVGTAVAVGYAAYLTYSVSKKNDSAINQRIRKDEPKIVDTVDVEDLGNKSVFCRCWKSKKFPYCDGAHAAHNKECGDNVGPLIVQKREPQST